MRSYKLLSILFIAFVLFGLEDCKKNLSTAPSLSGDQALIENAREYFQENVSSSAHRVTGNPRLDAVRNPDWGSAYCVRLSTGPAVIVPVFYQQDLVVTTNFSGGQVLPLNQLTKLVIYKDSAGYNMEVVTSFPDSAAKGINSGPFSGILFVETWEGVSLKTYKYSRGEIWLKQAGASAGAENGKAKTVIPDAATMPETVITTCYETSGYNYADGDPENGYSWTEPAGCSYQFILDGGGGGGGAGSLSGGDLGSVAGGAGKPNTSEIVLYTGNNIIANAADYMKCFSNYGGNDHTYQVTICVSQPAPGTRAPWTTTAGGPGGSSATGNPVDVGHTYLVFAEIFSDHSIVRNVGFYPQTTIYPWSPSSQGQLNNDDGHDYNVSLTVTVDNGQFFNMLNFVEQGNNPGYMYNLSSNNCTSFSLHALDAGGVVLPSTVGSWPGGGFGNDPGDLGEDIRAMQLSSKMTRSTAYTSRPNLYNCN